MSDVEMNGIINMTRSDPAFDALFQLFDNGKCFLPLPQWIYM